MRARVSVYYIFVCDLRAPKTDFEKSQALGKKYYGHPVVRAIVIS